MSAKPRPNEPEAQQHSADTPAPHIAAFDSKSFSLTRSANLVEFRNLSTLTTIRSAAEN